MAGWPVLAAGAILLAAGGCASMDYSRSPQWRGKRFENPPGSPPRVGLGALLKWQLGDRPVELEFDPPRRANDGARLRANRDLPSLTWIGHATVLVQAGGLSILTDPVFEDRVGTFQRRAPPGVALADLPPIDVVLISHNHYDHLSASSVRAIGPAAAYVVPLGLGPWMRARGLDRVVELDWWEATTVRGRSGGEARVTLVPAQHWSTRTMVDENKSLWGGFVVEAGGQRHFFAGDTAYPAAFAEVGRRFPGIDCAMLPIGAYAPRWFMRSQHMDPAEAVKAFRELGARALLPIHWATFKLSDEPMGEPIELLRQEMGAEAWRIVDEPIGGTRWGEVGREPAPAKAVEAEAR